MELIKLPINLGLEVVKKLKEVGIEPRVNKVGLISFEFTNEELSRVTELELINPTANCLEGIEHLSNLRSLKISTKGETAYINGNTSICDNDIKRISKLKSLRELTIDNQSGISWVDLDSLVNLEILVITRNSSIDLISGLNQLLKVKEVSIYGNKNLYKIEGIIDLLQNVDLDLLELDLINYPEVISLKRRLDEIPNCNFVEVLSGLKIIYYNYSQLYLFHQKCLQILELIKSSCINLESKIVGIEKYLCENITYDRTGLNTKDRVSLKDGKQRGKQGGTNSAYNGIMFGTCVCEGYTRSMQYLLKLLGVKTEAVHCISGAEKIGVGYKGMVHLPDDGYHSIIRIDDKDYLYCDPCWDACMWQSGNQTLPYCLLNREEMSRDHTLSFEENVVSNNHISIPRAQIQGILESVSTLEQKNNEKDKRKTF